MKRLLITLTLLLGTSLFANELSWVDKQVEAIKPPRSGMKNRSLSTIKDPFIFLKKMKKDEKPTSSTKATSSSKSVSIHRTKSTKQVLTLLVVLNNKAMINNNWYKQGDKLNGYTIKEINTHSVLLIKKKKKLLLSTKSSNKNLKFNNK